MHAGGLAQMSLNNFTQSNGMAMSSGLASRRGGQNIKPLSFDGLKNPADVKDNGIPTPRTSRSHLLAGLRTAPKTASAATFPNNPASPTAGPSANSHMRNRNSVALNMYGGNENMYNGPKTSVPRFAQQQQPQFQQQEFQQPQQQLQQQQQQQLYNPMTGTSQNFTPDQILAPPQLQIGEDGAEGMDPYLYEKLLATNLHLAQQQQRLQQQLLSIQQAAQQFGGMNLNGLQSMQQAYGNIYQQQQQQQQQFKNLQPLMTSTAQGQGNIYAVYNPMTGQQEYYLDQSANNAQMNAQILEQYNLALQQQQQQQQNPVAPHVQVSPPSHENFSAQNGFRNPTPPRRFESPIENPAPLPPPSANAFRRGHKKATSFANGPHALSIATGNQNVGEVPKSAGPKTSTFPMTPMTGTYMPGQQRAGEHPTRQPRGPPSFDELKSKPTSKHEGSKNFVARARRSAVHNLVRAGKERRKDTRSSGSFSLISESAEEQIPSPLSEPDNDSDSVRSGSGSLHGDDVEVSPPSSRTSTGSWGAIGSDRPSSRQKGRSGADSPGHNSDSETGSGSFASVFKNAGKTEAAAVSNGQRKAPMLVLTSAKERKSSTSA